MPTMKAALYDGKGAMVLTDFKRPEPGPGDVIVRVRATGICGSDLQMNAGKTGADTRPGGHEVAGEIVEAGPGVDRALLGGRVAIETIGHGLACLRCWYCRMGQFRQCLEKAPNEGGGFAQYIKRKAHGCYPLPDNLSWEEGALVEPFSVSIHGVRRGQLAGGEVVAVLGAGNIGLTAVAAARALGAGKVFVTAKHEHQAALAKLLGADDAFPPDGAALKEALAGATDGRGADMTIETVGGWGGETLTQAVEMTRMQGRVVMLGSHRAPVTLDWMGPMLKEQTFVFSSCYSVIDGRHDYELAIDLMASGKVPLKRMVTHKFPLEQVQKGFETAASRNAGSIKVQIHQE